jgi:putative ABC transporter-associated repeat protein
VRRITRTRTTTLLAVTAAVALLAGLAPAESAAAASMGPASTVTTPLDDAGSGSELAGEVSSNEHAKAPTGTDTTPPVPDKTVASEADGSSQTDESAPASGGADSANPDGTSIDGASTAAPTVGSGSAADGVDTTHGVDAAQGAAPDRPRFTVRDGVRVYDAGWLAMAPKVHVDGSGAATEAEFGLVDRTVPDEAAATWTPAAQSVVHIQADGAGAFRLPAVDATLDGTSRVYGAGATAADYSAAGGLLFGFHNQEGEGEVNGTLGKGISYGTAYTLEQWTGENGWSADRSDINWDQEPYTPTLARVWSSESSTERFISGRGNYAQSPGWTFRQPGTYCFTISETIRTKPPKGSPATELGATGTYTVVVGDLPSTVKTCSPPTDDGPQANLVDRGHHDLRTYLGTDGELRWGLDSALLPLDDVVLGRTPPAQTVRKPSGATDMRVVGAVGTKYWYFPSTSTAGDDWLWPGWSTESLDRSLLGSKVGVSLDGFTRNGTQDRDARVMLLADTSGQSSSTLFDSRRGVTSFDLSGNTHAHNIWVFTEPGVYCVAMTATAKTAAGHWTSAQQNLAFAVADEVDSSTVAGCGDASVPPLSSVLPTVQDRSAPTPLERGVARIDLGLEGSTVDSVAETGRVQTDSRLVRDPEDLILHGARFDQQTGQWSANSSIGGAVVFGTDGIDPTSVVDRHVSVQLGAVDGPGTVSAINTDGQKDYAALSTAIGGSRTMDLPVRSTDQGLKWYFSKPGVYCVPITYGATTSDGRRATGSDTLTFAVGPEQDGSGIDLSDVTTCSRGQEGIDLSQSGGGGGTDEGPSREDVFVENGSPNRAGATVLNDGHVDVASRLQGSRLDTVVKDTTESAEPTWRDLRRTVLQLLPGSKTTVPSGYDFLGKAGSPVWQVDQTQQTDLLWPGWSTESLPEDATKGGVTWALNDVQGYPDDDGDPTAVGEFSLYEQVGFGEPEVLMSSTGDRSFVISKNVHAHGTWAFSREGVYCMAMTRSAIAADGSDLQDDFVMAIAVGYVSVQDVDPAQCFSGKPPQGAAEGTAGGRTSTADEGEDAAAATPSQPALSLPGAVCTAAPATSATAASTAATGAGAPATTSTTVISRGHVDVGSRIVDGKLRTLVKDGSQGGVIWREPSTTALWLKPAAKVASPGGAFSFLGVTGSPAWQIPQTQNPDLVWLGWNTEELTAAQAAGPVQWRLDSVDGPGRVTVYELASFGAPEQILTAGGTTSIPLGVHAHGNWGFTAEGTYRLHMTQTVPLAGGGTSSDQQTLTVVVGGSAPRTTSSGGGGGTKAVAAKAADGCTSAVFGSTVPAITQADEPETAAQGGGTTAGGVRPVGKAAPAEPTPAGKTRTWLLAVIGFGGVLGAGGAGSLATWLLTRRRGLGA